jgi:hypothetical protein
MRLLTGIRIQEDPSAGELHVELNSSSNAYTKGLPKGLAYGTDVNVEAIKSTFDHRLYLKDPSDPSLIRDLPGFRISPRFFADDSKSVVLGRLAGVNKPGLVVKKLDGWTSIYSSAPILPAPLLRNIAREAGAHIYSDADDVIYANDGFVTIYSPKGGTRTIFLRKPATVVDSFDGTVLATGVSSFSLSMPPNTAKLLMLK